VARVQEKGLCFLLIPIIRTHKLAATGGRGGDEAATSPKSELSPRIHLTVVVAIQQQGRQESSGQGPGKKGLCSANTK
jgi:hypothetical protein